MFKLFYFKLLTRKLNISLFLSEKKYIYIAHINTSNK